VTSALLREAISLHERGAIDEAAVRYARVLTLEPTNVDALFYAGLAHCQQGNFAQAVTALERAVTLAPANAAVHNLLGLALKNLGRLTEALSCFDRAAALQPNFIDPQLARAGTLVDMHRWAEAADGFDRVLTLAPNLIAAWCDRGVALEQMGRYEEAIASYDRALALKPDLAEAHANRGNALAALRCDQEAVESFDRALAARPDFIDVYINRGNSLRRLLRLEEALASYERALMLQPGLAEAQFSRASVLVELGRFSAAIEAFDRILAPSPVPDQSHSGQIAVTSSVASHLARPAAEAEFIAVALQLRAWAANQCGRFDEVFDALGRALELAPHNDGIRYQAAIMELLHGRWREAWPKHESPERYQDRLLAQFAAGPWLRWQGETLDDGVLVLVSEQGLGDAIHFSMFATHLAGSGFRVVIFTLPVLAPLLARVQGVERALSDFDQLAGLGKIRWLPLMSVPAVLGTTPSTVPQVVPYISAEPERVAAWRQRLGPAGFKVGLAWQGNIKNLNDRFRSIPLASMAPLAAISGIRLLSLQKGAGTEQIASVEFGHRIETPLDNTDVSANALLETAAVTANLDLVVTLDSMPVHLACALGRPTFLALRHVPEWRWLIGREDSPWYPSLRLFRQTTDGDWEGVFERIAAALRDRLAVRPHG
jgi:tetratricopeptide (TPR) repeat protein